MKKTRVKKPQQSLFRKVPIDVWGLLQALPPMRQLLYFWITTGPHVNRAGLFPFSIVDAADRFGISLVEAREYLAALCALFGWQHDAANRVLWLSDWWDTNSAFRANESALQAALKDLRGLPRTPLLRTFAEHGPQTQDVDQDRFEAILDDTVGDWWRTIPVPTTPDAQVPPHQRAQVSPHCVLPPCPPTVGVDDTASRYEAGSGTEAGTGSALPQGRNGESAEGERHTRGSRTVADMQAQIRAWGGNRAGVQ